MSDAFEVKANITELCQAKAIGTPGTADEAMFNGSPSNRVWVGVSGNIQIFLLDKSTVSLNNLIAGRWHVMPPFRGFNASGTTATGIVVAETI